MPPGGGGVRACVLDNWNRRRRQQYEQIDNDLSDYLREQTDRSVREGPTRSPITPESSRDSNGVGLTAKRGRGSRADSARTYAADKVELDFRIFLRTAATKYTLQRYLAKIGAAINVSVFRWVWAQARTGAGLILVPGFERVGEHRV